MAELRCCPSICLEGQEAHSLNVITLMRQHTITASVFQFWASSVTQHLVDYRVSSFYCDVSCEYIVALRVLHE